MLDSLWSSSFTFKSQGKSVLWIVLLITWLLIRSCLTEHINSQTIYKFDYIIFYIDMNNKRSWRICETSFEQVPSSFLYNRSCAIINHCLVWILQLTGRFTELDSCFWYKRTTKSIKWKAYSIYTTFFKNCKACTLPISHRIVNWVLIQQM